MLKHFWSCNTALLIHVTDEEHRDPVRFGAIYECQSRLSYLSNASGCGFDHLVVYGLYRVDYHDIGLYLVCLLEDAVKICFGKNVEIFARNAEPLGAELDLTARFLARNIKNSSVCSETLGYLHK